MGKLFEDANSYSDDEQYSDAINSFKNLSRLHLTYWDCVTESYAG